MNSTTFLTKIPTIAGCSTPCQSYDSFAYHESVLSEAMDGLSGAASGIAVVSLTFQIVESISKLQDFFESMQGAPAFVATIRKDLAQCSSILGSINLDEQRYKDVLTTCMDKIVVLSAIIDDLEPGFQSTSRKHRKWTAFRTARRVPILKNFRETLEETKTTLVLALQARHLLAR